MLGEMLIMVSGQFKNDKCHLMSVLDITQTLTAHQIGIKIHVRKVARHSVVKDNFLQFWTARFGLLQHNF